jgi:Helix-turn-helix domain
MAEAMRDAAAGQGASPFLSNDQAAAFLNLSPRTLEKYRVIGGGPQFRKFGRRVQYAIDDLQTWAAKRTCNSTSDPSFHL